MKLFKVLVWLLHHCPPLPMCCKAISFSSKLPTQSDACAMWVTSTMQSTCHHRWPPSGQGQDIATNFLVGDELVSRWPTYPQNTLKIRKGTRLGTLHFWIWGMSPPKFFTAGDVFPLSPAFDAHARRPLHGMQKKTHWTWSTSSTDYEFSELQLERKGSKSHTNA